MSSLLKRSRSQGEAARGALVGLVIVEVGLGPGPCPATRVTVQKEPQRCPLMGLIEANHSILKFVEKWDVKFMTYRMIEKRML